MKLSYAICSINALYAENRILFQYALPSIEQQEEQLHQIIRSPSQLGAIIRGARRDLGWTQSQLADLSGLRQELISKIETGHESTKLSSLHALFGALGLDLVVEKRSTGKTLDIGDIF